MQSHIYSEHGPSLLARITPASFPSGCTCQPVAQALASATVRFHEGVASLSLDEPMSESQPSWTRPLGL